MYMSKIRQITKKIFGILQYTNIIVKNINLFNGVSVSYQSTIYQHSKMQHYNIVILSHDLTLQYNFITFDDTIAQQY